MGAWGSDAFDNDTACDWAYGLEAVDDLSLVAEALSAVLDVGEEYLDSDVACEALAACEVIARLNGNWGIRTPYTETVDRWVEAHSIPISPDLMRCATTVIDRVVTPPSELLELWEEGDEAHQWRNAVDNLRGRVARV